MSEHRDPAGRRGLEDRFGYPRTSIAPVKDGAGEVPAPDPMRELMRDLRLFLDPGRRLAPYSFYVRVQADQVLEQDDDRLEVWLFNAGGATIYLGVSRVVAVGSLGGPQGGHPLLAGTGLIIDKGARDELWVIAGIDGQDLRVTETVRRHRHGSFADPVLE